MSRPLTIHNLPNVHAKDILSFRGEPVEVVQTFKSRNSVRVRSVDTPKARSVLVTRAMLEEKDRKYQEAQRGFRSVLRKEHETLLFITIVRS